MKINLLKKLWTAARALLVIAVVSSCNFKKVDRVSHESGISPDGSDVVVSTKSEPVFDADKLEVKISEFDFSSINARLSSIKSSQDALSIIKDLEPVSINASVWSSPKVNFHPKVLESLTIYNKAISKLLVLNDNSDAIDSVLKKYQDMAFQGCNEKLENCKNVAWLRTDSYSAGILAGIVARLDKTFPEDCSAGGCNEKLKQYYNIMSVAFALANFQDHLDLKSLYLKRAIQYADLFKDKNSKDEARLIRHGRIFENILNSHPTNVKNDRLETIVKQFKPWAYSRLRANAFSFGAEKIFNYAAQHMMYSGMGSELSPEFMQAIQKIQNEGDTSGKSFKQRFNELAASADGKVALNGFRFDPKDIQDEGFYNEYFYMVDRLYRDHLNLEDVGNIWKGSKRDEKKLILTVLLYLRFEIISKLAATNQYFTKIMMRKDLTSESLFKKTVSDSEPLTQDWQKLFTRVEKLLLFLTQQTNFSPQPGLSDQIAQTSELSDYIQYNTKLTSVYPNMLMNGYFMIVANAGIKFETWWGAEITIEPTIVVNWMLNGNFDQPWYAFSGNKAPLNKTEIVYALYYALNGGAFEVFSQVKDEKNKSVLTRVDFFSKALKKTVEEDLKKIDDATDEINQFRNGDKDVKIMLDICQKEATDPTKNYEITMDLIDLQHYALTGGTTKGLGATAAKFYAGLRTYYAVSGQNDAKDSEDTLRAKLQGRLMQMKAMRVPMVDNINRMQVSVDEKTKMINGIDAEISAIEMKLKNFLELSISMHDEIQYCLSRLAWMERERQAQLFKKEIEYYTAVYNAMTKIREATEEKVKASLISSVMKDLGIKKKDSITGDFFSVSKLDLLRRLEHFSKQLKPSLKTNDPNSNDEDVLKTARIDIQFISFATGKPISKEEFVGSAMANYNTQGQSIVDWLKETHSIAPFERQLSSMIAMYRLALDLGIPQDSKLYIQPIKILEKTMEMVKYSNIQDWEKQWMVSMSQPEIIAKKEFRGFIFDDFEVNYSGVFDSVYNQATRLDSDLIEANRYAIESKKKGALIFPIPEREIIQVIDQLYINQVKTAQRTLCEFDQAIVIAESTLKPIDLQIIYRMQNGSPVVYSPSLISGGQSLGLDVRRTSQVNGNLKNFFREQSSNLYVEEKCK